jgi:hypothetical protein
MLRSGVQAQARGAAEVYLTTSRMQASDLILLEK